MSVRYCYELTEFEFPAIEGRFYVMVAKNGEPTRSISVRSSTGVSININKQQLEDFNYRMDYNYLSSWSIYNGIRKNLEFSIVKLSDISCLTRGKASAPFEKNSVIHTTSYSDGWDVTLPMIRPIESDRVYAQGGDILLKRVGRKCLKTFGLYSLKRKQEISDCVFRITVNDGVSAMKVLFSLRVLYSGDLGEQFLNKGTGAKFITARDLSNAPVIYNIDKIFPNEYRAWNSCVQENHMNRASDYEDLIRGRLFERHESLEAQMKNINVE